MRYLPARPRPVPPARRPGRGAAWLATVAAGLLALTGCHAMGGAAAGPAVHAALTVTAAPGVPDAPLFIAIRDGLFRSAGLTVHVRVAASVKTEVSRLESGAAGIAFADYPDLFAAQGQRPSPHLKFVADGYDCGPNVMEVLTLPSSHINSALDLTGKTIGTPLPQVMTPDLGRPYSLETTAAWAALENDGVAPTGIHWDPMPASNLAPSLSAHQVDAILVTEPTITEAETQLGVVPVLDACSGPTANLPLYGYVTTASYADKNPAVVRAFRSALLKAQADAASSAPVQTALESYAQLDKQTAALVTLGTYPTSTTADNIQRVVDLMFRYNMIKSLLDVGHLILR